VRSARITGAGARPGGPASLGSRGRLNISYARQLAVSAAEAAGGLLDARWQDDLGLRPKGSGGDVVTDLDLAAERLIVARIRDAFPEHQIIAEEAGLIRATDDSWTWLVDPLDGTNNVAIGLHACVVGLALCEERLPVLGVVHDPVTRQTWTAIRGAGAFGPHDTPLYPAYERASHGPVLAWTQGHCVPPDDATARVLRVVLDATARRVLQLWAPLLAWVMLARGAIDGFIGYRAGEVDLSAGALIAAEAGAVVLGLDGAPFDERIGLRADDRSFVAGRPQVIGRLLDLVKTARRLEEGYNDLWTTGVRAGW
jgi:myo-inositol-1(or 4)-monophosphatase